MYLAITVLLGSVMPAYAGGACSTSNAVSSVMITNTSITNVTVVQNFSEAAQPAVQAVKPTIDTAADSDDEMEVIVEPKVVVDAETQAKVDKMTLPLRRALLTAHKRSGTKFLAERSKGFLNLTPKSQAAFYAQFRHRTHKIVQGIKQKNPSLDAEIPNLLEIQAAEDARIAAREKAVLEEERQQAVRFAAFRAERKKKQEEKNHRQHQKTSSSSQTRAKVYRVGH